MPSFGWAAAAQGQYGALPNEAFQVVVIDPHPHPKADQPRGHNVDHLRSTKPLLEVTNTVASA
jgi:hypothetical protein